MGKLHRTSHAPAGDPLADVGGVVAETRLLHVGNQLQQEAPCAIDHADQRAPIRSDGILFGTV